jgi:hypothetical protein
MGATVSALDQPSGGGNWPNPYDPQTYCTTVALTTENWWSPNCPPADEAVLLGYMQAGGGVYFSGQDYLYGAGYPDGSMAGMFPYEMGLGSVTQDTPFGTPIMDVLGAPGSMYASIYMSLGSASVFLANPFYPDTFNPRPEAAVAYDQISPETHPGAVYYDSGTYRVFFTSLELAADGLLVFPDHMALTWEWLKSYCVPVPLEETTFGSIRASYR